MTKTAIFGKNDSAKNTKGIEFCKYINLSGVALKTDSLQSPSDWDNIVLLIDSHDTDEKYDTMYAYDSDDPNCGCIFLGYWNNGIA